MNASLPQRSARAAAALATALLLVALAAACGGSSVTPSVIGSGGLPPTVTAAKACSLLSAADVASLGLTEPGSEAQTTVAGSTASVCNWGTAPALNLHVQSMLLPNAAAAGAFVGMPHPSGSLPGIGDGAGSEFGSLLASITFLKGSTVVSLLLTGNGAGAKKDALIAVARSVAGRI